MQKHLFTLLAMLYAAAMLGQNITSGPIVGGVTPTQARIFVATQTPRAFTLEVADNTNFDSPQTISSATTADRFSTVIVNLQNLTPQTTYYYRFVFNGQPDERQGQFKTFAPVGTKGNYRIVVGSCNYNNNFPLFEQINGFNADLFIHLGDWNWPPASLGADMFMFPQKQAESFKMRYNDANMRNYVQPYCPVTYVYDDDWGQNDSEPFSFPSESVTVDTVTGFAINTMTDTPLPIGLRDSSIMAYYRYFPAWAIDRDTLDGLYHTIQLGNIDIFMTDNRHNRSRRHDAFTYDTLQNQFYYQPDTPNHTILGEAQRNWLLNKITTSTADWKVIGSGVVFNKGYKRILDYGMLFQRIPFTFAGRFGSGITLANAMAYNWVGYPIDHQALLNLKDQGVKDIVFVSGDSHSSVLDDGTNAGLPEMNASGLAAGDEGFLNYYIDSVSQQLGQPPIKDSLWNGGGNGVGNANFNDTYGTIETWGSDSLQMCVVDELGQTLGCITLRHSSLPTSITDAPIDLPKNLMFLAYPNPTKDKLNVTLHYAPKPTDYITVTNAQGQTLQTLQNLHTLAPNQNAINLTTQPAGVYFINLVSYRGTETRKVVLSR